MLIMALKVNMFRVKITRRLITLNKRTKFPRLIGLLMIGFLLVSLSCAPNNNQPADPVESNPPSELNIDTDPNSGNLPPTLEKEDLNPNIEVKEPLTENTFEAAKLKYYQYFNKYNRRIHPIFPYTGELDKDTESRLMIFAISNLENYNYKEGHDKEEFDDILIKYFGQTVKNYNTSASKYIPGTQKITATGFSYHGGLRLVLTKLISEKDRSLTGSFDVYYIPEMYAIDDPDGWKKLDDILLSDNRRQLSKLLSNKAIINFNEIAEQNNDFYLKYNTIKLLEIDSPINRLDIGDNLDKRNFDPNTRFAADEATFNGISTTTTKKQLIAKLGEPFEILVDDGKIYLPATTYIYAGVEYVFEGESETISHIVVTNFQQKHGPRNIRIGDDFEDVLARFPQEQDYKTHPESCFYGETTYNNESGAVYTDFEGNIDHITLVTKDVIPFVKIHFQNNLVASYAIYGSTT